MCLTSDAAGDHARCPTAYGAEHDRSCSAPNPYLIIASYTSRYSHALFTLYLFNRAQTSKNLLLLFSLSGPVPQILTKSSVLIQTFKFGAVSHVNIRAKGSESSRGGISRPSPRTREGDILVDSSDLPRCFYTFDARCVPCQDLVS